MNEPLKLILIGVAALSASAASAQQSPSQDDDIGVGTIFRGALETGVSYTDNAYYVDGSREQQDATGFLIRPELSISRILPRFRLSANAGAEVGLFDLPDDQDDYTDYQATLGAQWLSALRHSWTFASALREDHDPFGTERTENTPLATRELDQWREIGGNIGYRYGMPTDRYNVDLLVRALNRTYTTNRAETQYLEYESAAIQLATYYNVTSKSSLFAMIAGGRTTYETVEPGFFDRSSTELRYGIGANWKASAKTTGDVRLGYVDRRRRNSDDDGFTSLDWTASLLWSPRSYRSFDLQTGRASQESYLNNVEFINNRFVALSWTEQWTQLLQSKLGARFLDSEFVGSTRTDQASILSLDIQYRALRNLTLLATASSNMVDSEASFDSSFAEYDRFYGYLGVRYSR